jgi:alkylated DNA repair dioxygenase AlkB
MTDKTVARGFGFVSEEVRTTAFFSRLCRCGYDYDKGRSVQPGLPFPPIILDILAYVMPICGVNDEALWPTACNANFYKDGYYITYEDLYYYITNYRSSPLGWHEDNEPMHGPLHEPYAILSLSLGATRNFLIRETRSRKVVSTIPLKHGDLVSMNGLFQSLFQHRYLLVIRISYCDLFIL